MALLPSEIARIRVELGYNVLGPAAEPYVEYHGVLDRVITLFLQSSASTTSSTAVVAATTPAPSTLTLASATGFSAFDTVIVDVDSRQERATVQAISGSTITLLLSKAHTGTYPVTVEGGEAIIRRILGELEVVQTKILTASNYAGLKRAEDIEWYPAYAGTTTGALLNDLLARRMLYRDELASALGVTNLWRLRRSGGQVVALY